MILDRGVRIICWYIVRWVQIRTRTRTRIKIRRLKSRGLFASATIIRGILVRVRHFKIVLFVSNTRTVMPLLYRARSQYVMSPSTTNRPFVAAIIVILTQCTFTIPKVKSYVRSTVTAVTFSINPVRKRVTVTR